MKFSINRVKAGLGEVQTTHRWAVSIVKPAKVVGEFPEDLEVRIQSTGMPTAEAGTMRVELGGHDIGYNGKVKKSGTLPWTAIEGTDARFTTYMAKWFAGRWGGDGQDTTGKAALTEDCKADVKIDLLDHEDKITISYVLIGCLPSTENGDTLGQDAGPLSPTASFEYDDYHIIGKDFKW